MLRIGKNAAQLKKVGNFWENTVHLKKMQRSWKIAAHLEKCGAFDKKEQIWKMRHN